MSEMTAMCSASSSEVSDELVVKNCIIINRETRSDLWDSLSDARSRMQEAGIGLERVPVNLLHTAPPLLQKVEKEGIVIPDSLAWQLVEEGLENDLDIAVAHYRALKRVVDEKWDSCLIMEDNIDVVGYDFNNLGMKDWCDICVHTPNKYYKSNNCLYSNSDTLAYSVTLSGARKLLKYMFPLKISFLQSLKQKILNYELTYQVMDENQFFKVSSNNESLSNLDTFATEYGKVTLYKNDIYIGDSYKSGKYWDIDSLLALKKYIDPDRNVLEIGGHCGTSSLVYASFLKKGKVEVYEPQYKMYEILLRNINQNGLQNKIFAHNLGVFCYSGQGKMNSMDYDGGGGNVQKRYDTESELSCNFGGIPMGDDGETIELTTIDSMNLNNIGFIHCDAQGAETFIFSKGLELIKECRPVIIYENNKEAPPRFGRYLYDHVCRSYPQYKEESIFDIKKYCLETLNYSQCIDNFDNSVNTLLIP